MSVAQVAIAVLIFWSLLHVFNRLLRRKNQRVVLPSNLSKRRFGNRIDASLRYVHLHIQTTSCNPLHDRFTALLASKRYKQCNTALSWFYSFGCLAAVVGLIGACIILLWTSWSLAWNTVKVPNQKTSTLHSHEKRDTVHSTSRSQGWYTIEPIVSRLWRSPYPDAYFSPDPRSHCAFLRLTNNVLCCVYEPINT